MSPNLTLLDRWAFEPRRVDKPWGYELIWALADAYCGKLLVVKAGQAISMQFHREKDESWLLHTGRAQLEMGAPGDKTPNSEIVGPGAAFRIKPGTIHRVKALEDTTIIEVSTPQLEDVVRLDDRYGRVEP